MMTMRNSACLLLCVGVGLALENTGCQWISGLDEVRVDSNNDEERTSSGAGGAGGSHGIGGMGGAPIGSGTTSGGGSDQVGLCNLLDLPPQAPTLCSNEGANVVDVSFVNQCDTGEVIDVYWIPAPDGNGNCDTLKWYATITGKGAIHSQGTVIGHRWRLVDQISGRVLKDEVVVEKDGQVITVP